jgi:hypothetical protein
MPSKGEGRGPTYRVDFMNRFARGGQVFIACRRSIEIRSAKTRERAIEAAKKRFARQEGSCDWYLHASIFEVEAFEGEVLPVDNETVTPRGKALTVRESRGETKRTILPQAAD